MSRLNILINCFHFPRKEKGAGGAGAFISAVLPELGKMANVRVFVSTENYNDFSFKEVKAIKATVFPDPNISQWWNWADIYYDPQNGLTPLNIPINLPVVSQIYDIQHEVLPHLFSPEIYAARNKDYSWAIKRADSVFTISDQEKSNIERFIPGTKVYKIYLAAFLYEYVQNNSADILSSKLDRTNSYLYPAVKWPHKNHFRLIEAFTLANNTLLSQNRDPMHLILTGSSHSLSNDLISDLIQILQQNKNIQFKGFISNDELALEYLTAKGLIFPSLYEGFGIPVIDALKFELPALVNRETCLYEVCGDSIKYFQNASDVMKMANDIITFDSLINEQKLDTQTGLIKAKSYSTKKIVSDMLVAFQETIKNKNISSDLKLRTNKIYDPKPIVTIIKEIEIENFDFIKEENQNYSDFNVIYIAAINYKTMYSIPENIKCHFFLKGSKQSKILALENILRTDITGDYTLLIDHPEPNKIINKIDLAIAFLQSHLALLSVLITSDGEKESFHQQTNENSKIQNSIIENFTHWASNAKYRFFPNFIFPTWALRDGGMIGSEKRIAHFVKEEHIVI